MYSGTDFKMRDGGALPGKRPRSRSASCKRTASPKATPKEPPPHFCWGVEAWCRCTAMVPFRVPFRLRPCPPISSCCKSRMGGAVGAPAGLICGWLLRTIRQCGVQCRASGKLRMHSRGRRSTSRNSFALTIIQVQINPMLRLIARTSTGGKPWRNYWIHSQSIFL